MKTKEELEQVTGGIIHEVPKHEVQCSLCGATFLAPNYLDEARIQVCPRCQPFFTGKTTKTDPGSRINKYKERYGGK